MPYEPQEDSYMLSEQVKKFANGFVLDIGTGSGIQVSAALESKRVKKVIGIDISKEAVEYCTKKFGFSKKAEFFVSDLFAQKKFSAKIFFDTIIFNPPYLPSELKLRDLTTEGGKKGYETIERFLNEVNNFLKPDGIILLLFSSFTKKEMIDKIIRDNLLEFELLDTKHIFFEDLYVYKIKKSEILRKLEAGKVSRIKFYKRGMHGMIYQGIYKKKKVIIKIKNPKSHAIDTIKKEIFWLRRLSRYKICPKLLFGDEDFAVMEFIGGELILDFIKNNPSANVKKVLKEILRQMYLLDKLGITKEEMHRPLKHIIVQKMHSEKKMHSKNAFFSVLIDFERAHFTEKPKNVTQFCDFLMRCSELLKEKGITIKKEKIIGFAGEYKNIVTHKNN